MSWLDEGERVLLIEGSGGDSKCLSFRFDVEKKVPSSPHAGTALRLGADLSRPVLAGSVGFVELRVLEE